MSVRGSLRTMSVEDILDWVDRRFISGALVIARGAAASEDVLGGLGLDLLAAWGSGSESGETPALSPRSGAARAFVFNSGRLVSARSSYPNEQLGQLLLHRGLIDEAALREAFEVQRETGVLIGRILIMVGAVEEPALLSVLQAQAREGLVDALAWTGGAFSFERNPARGVELELALDVRSCIEEAERRQVDWTAIRSLIPSDDLAPTLIDRGALFRAEDDADTRERLGRLAHAVARCITVDEIVHELPGGRFQLLGDLALLIGRGAIAVPEPEPEAEPEPADQPEPRPETAAAHRAPESAPRAVAPGDPSLAARRAAELLARARAASAQGRRGEALELAREALSYDPNGLKTNSYVRNLERALFAELSRELLAAYRIPRLAVSADQLAALDLTDDERSLIGRVDGRWDLLSLIRVSPLGTVDALITFKQLAERGIISL